VNAFRTLLLAGVLGVAGCTAAGCSTTPSAPAAVPPTVQVSSQPAAVAFGGTDRAWIEINIAMDEQLLPLLELASARASEPAVRDLLAQVKAFTDAELGTLRQLHTLAALPAENPHKGMPMPGMVTSEQVVAAGKLTGDAFDKAVVQHVEAHLEQSQKLAVSENKSGVEPQTRELAAEVLRTRSQTLSAISDLSRGAEKAG
jgi:uncharacterized protein (DUF305 family)